MRIYELAWRLKTLRAWLGSLARWGIKKHDTFSRSTLNSKKWSFHTITPSDLTKLVVNTDKAEREMLYANWIFV